MNQPNAEARPQPCVPGARPSPPHPLVATPLFTATTRLRAARQCCPVATHPVPPLGSAPALLTGISHTERSCCLPRLVTTYCKAHGCSPSASSLSCQHKAAATRSDGRDRLTW